MGCLNVTAASVSVCLDIDVKRCDKLDNVKVYSLNTPFDVNISNIDKVTIAITNKDNTLKVVYSIVCDTFMTVNDYEAFFASDGDFILKDGGTLYVLKNELLQ